MGSCASAYVRYSDSKKKDKNDDDDDQKMMIKKSRLRLVFSTNKAAANSNNKANNNNIIIISEQHNPGTTTPPQNSPPPPGSKEDTFFDSKAWLDSDCEDDFFSVKGDFTPSQGNTPIHHNFSIATQQVSRSLFNESTPEPSPNKKKRLSELFQESLREEQGVDFEDLNNENRANTKVENKTTIFGIPPKPINGTTPLSNERASNNGDYRAQKKNTTKSAQCCLPKMLLSRSFNERSKMSPAKSIG